MNSKIEEIKGQIIPILQKYRVTRAGVFGSVAKGEDRPDSDIDILFSAPLDMSLFKMIHLKDEIADKLGRNVDLVEYHTIKPVIKDEILNSEVRIYEQG